MLSIQALEDESSRLYPQFLVIRLQSHADDALGLGDELFPRLGHRFAQSKFIDSRIQLFWRTIEVEADIVRHPVE